MDDNPQSPQTPDDYGFCHFRDKYGLPMIRSSGGEITVRCRGGTAHDIIIRSTRAAQMGHSVEGHVVMGEKSAPLFVIPKETSHGEHFAHFRRGSTDFPVISLEKNTVHVGFDIFHDIGKILSGHLEEYWKAGSADSHTVSKQPLLDIYEDILLECIKSSANKLGTSLETKPLWPDNKPFAVCFTHDVDKVKKTYQYITHLGKRRRNSTSRINKGAPPASGKGLKDPYWCFPIIKQIEEKHNIRSTFYFLDERGHKRQRGLKGRLLAFGSCRITLPEVRRTIKTLNDAGWEIGVHGSFTSYTDEEILQKERKALSKIIGEDVAGIRQHFLKIEIPRTWAIQGEAGFTYDTSLGFSDRCGFRWATTFPFHPTSKNGTPLSILEIPLTLMDGPLFSGSNPEATAIEVIDAARKVGGVAIILWHQRVFNEREFPDWSGLYEHLIAYCKENGAWITTTKELASWWRKRAQSIITEGANELQ